MGGVTPLNTPLDEIDLTRRCRVPLRNRGYNRVYDLVGVQVKALLKLEGFGRKHLNELRDALGPFGVIVPVILEDQLRIAIPPVNNNDDLDDEYSFLNREQWAQVCALLQRDIWANPPVDLSPANPGQECVAWFYLQTGGMQWAEVRLGLLSELCLASGFSSNELFEIAAGLEVSARRVRGHAETARTAERTGDPAARPTLLDAEVYRCP